MAEKKGKGLFGLFGAKEDKVEAEKAEAKAKDLAAKARKQNNDAKQAANLKKQKETMKAAAAKAAAAKAATAKAVKKHVVVSGDTLSGIAKKYYNDAGKYMVIYEANKRVIGDNPDMIKVGMELVIPKQ